eukprot:507670_1
MNHSITDNLLWITLFAVLYISSVNGQDQCTLFPNPNACSDCLNFNTCETGNPGSDGCGCHWVWTTAPVPDLTDGTCDHNTCDPTIDPTIDPTSDQTVDPTIDPTQMPTIPTTNPSTTPTASTGAPSA